MDVILNMKRAANRILVAIAFGVTFFILTGCSGRKTVDLNNYINYSFTGYDSYGHLDYRIEYEAMEQDLREIYKKQPEDTVDGLIMDLESEMYGSWNRETELSNGDAITYHWDISEESCKQYKKIYGLKVKYDDLKTEVSGLQELKEFDPFEDFHVEVSGYAGWGELTFRSDKYPGLSFVADKYNGLVPGDVVNFTLSEADIPFTCIELYGGTPSRTEMEYTVGQMDRLITEVKDIPDDLDSNMKSQLDDFVISSFADNGTTSIMNYEVLGYYILTPKSGAFKSQVYLVYKVSLHTETNNGSEDVTAYKYLQFRNAVAYKDGTGYVDLLDYDYPSGGWLGNDQVFKTSISSYAGFQNLNLLYNQCIASQLEMWKVDTDIQMQ